MKKRPALEYFLDTLGYPNFEVVLYTSEGTMPTMEPLLKSLDPKHRISFALPREAANYVDGHYVKVSGNQAMLL